MSRPSSPARVTYLGCMAMALASPFVCLACLQVSTGTGSDAGSATSAASDAGTTSASDATTGGWTGTSCGPDPQTGVVLCLGTSECPGATIDTSAFPSCGFHQGAASPFDLECICDGYELCPVGAPNSCNDVTQLLTQEMTSLQVCEQVSTGGCIALDAGAGSGSGSSSGGAGGTTGLSAACQACISSCGTTPACYQSCGC